MRTTYRMTLSDGKKTAIEASSASEAINEARWKCRERTIVECHAGLTQEEADLKNQIGCSPRAVAGIVTYDIPKHEAIPISAVKEKRVIPVDHTTAMFNEDDIRRESIRAKEAAAR